MTANTSKVTFTTWRDTARWTNNVRVHVSGAFVGSLEMTDSQLLAFADFINPPQYGSQEAGS